MSNAHDDPTRQKKGMSTLSKVLLIGCGGITTVGIVLAILLYMGGRRLLEENPGLLDTLGDAIGTQTSLAMLAPTGRISSDFGGSVATAMEAVLLGEEVRVEPGEEGSGFAFEVHFADGESTGVDLTAATELIARVEGGEASFAEILAEGPGTDAGYEPLPDWVLVHPDARRYGGAGGGFSASAPDLQLGTAVFLVDAGALEVVDWYDEADDRDDGVWMSTRGQTVEGFRPQAQVSLFGDNGLIVVLAVEDDDGATLFAVVYRG